jgi:hypothetical protein
MVESTFLWHSLKLRVIFTQSKGNKTHKTEPIAVHSRHISETSLRTGPYSESDKSSKHPQTRFP